MQGGSRAFEASVVNVTRLLYLKALGMRALKMPSVSEFMMELLDLPSQFADDFVERLNPRNQTTDKVIGVHPNVLLRHWRHPH